MSKIVVVYRSKSGFTKKYAKWVAEELNCDIINGKNAKISDVSKYETIIYGGSLFATGILGLKFITNNMDQLKNKNLIVFAVGATPAEETDKINGVRDANITKEQLERIDFFYFRGGFHFDALPFADRLLMTMLKKKLKSTKEPDKEQKGMLEAFDKPFDDSKRENIKPLIQCVKDRKEK